MTIDDKLRAIVAAMPASWLEDEGLTIFLKRFAEANPEYWLQPVSEAAAAEFLGIKPNALANRRARGASPDCWAIVDGRVEYASRLAILQWVAAKHELAKAA